MPVPTNISELSTTAGSNSPTGGDSVPVIDDHIRALAAFIAQLRDGKVATTGAGASGTWGISITGSAASANTATTATNSTQLGGVAAANFPQNSRTISAAGLATGGGDLSANRTITVTAASQVQAEAGTDTGTAMTPERTEQHMLANALGWGQTWQNVTRVTATDYQNTTGRPIMVAVTFQGRNGKMSVGVTTGSYVQVTGTTNGISDDVNARPVHTVIVPNQHYYRFADATINNVKELR